MVVVLTHGRYVYNRDGSWERCMLTFRSYPHMVVMRMLFKQGLASATGWDGT